MDRTYESYLLQEKIAPEIPGQSRKGKQVYAKPFPPMDRTYEIDLLYEKFMILD
jgi:hypothetical protein